MGRKMLKEFSMGMSHHRTMELIPINKTATKFKLTIKHRKVTMNTSSPTFPSPSLHQEVLYTRSVLICTLLLVYFCKADRELPLAYS